jgi:hypothetical protein
MPGSFREFNGVRTFEVPAQVPELRTGRDAVDLMGDASEHRVALIVIPVERLGEDFFGLRTRIAGEIVQKFATYGSRVAVVGDISQKIVASKSLAAFIAEANLVHHLWFVEGLKELGDRLGEYRAEE